MAGKSSLKLRPLGDRVIIEPLEGEDKSSGGILLPETAKEKPQKGVIVAVGPGRWDEDGKKRLEMEVALNDKVYFQRYSGQEIPEGDKKYLIMSEKDILAVIEK